MFTLILRILALIGLCIVPPYLVTQSYIGLGLGVVLGMILVITEIAFVKFNIIGVLSAASGSAIGFALFKFATYTLNKLYYPKISAFWNENTFAINTMFVLLGIGLGMIKAADFEYLNTELITRKKKKLKHLKVIDDTAAIDGRIIDLFETGFLAGTFLLPKFVLDKIQEMANSKDPLRRAKGRRGLDIIARLEESKDIRFKIIERKIHEGRDYAEKIVHFAKNVGADIITTDFNINKAAMLKNVTVLNIDDLTAALKPVVLPGEVMSIFVMKEGKEKSQGVGYLDDGTMVVVEEGRKWIGKKVDVAVYSILQTSAGRMIFVKPKSDSKVYQKSYRVH